MLLPENDAELIHKLYISMLVFIANKATDKIREIHSIKEFKALSSEIKLKVRDDSLKNLELIDDYIAENPDYFNSEYLAFLGEWRNIRREKFVVERVLKNYTIFLDANNSSKAYGVIGIYSEIEDLLPFVPCLVETVLLPWKGKIVCDGLIASYRVTFGKNIKTSFKEQYLNAKKEGIITSLQPF